MSDPFERPVHKIELANALQIIRDLAPKFRELGFHVALAGGVLIRGYSDKDIDLVIYSFGKERNKIFEDFSGEQLEKLGFELDYDPGDGSSNTSGDDMQIYVTRLNGIRIDVFVLR